jgi:hypothetical protein
MVHSLLANDQLISGWSNDLWYALALILVISLVYAATRHERMKPILIHAARVAIWIISFMAAVFAVLTAVLWCL